jgi:phenylalanyl-tRNA synthetase beta chain
MNLQEKLHVTHGRNRKKVAIGVHDFDKIKSPFTYKTAKFNEIKFIPLDSAKEMNLKEILQKHPKGTAYAHIFEGVSDYPVILDKNNNVVSFPPIINGELTRVSKNTKNLFIEITGTDELAVNQALNIVVSAVADRGGEVYCVDIKC